MTSVQAGGKVGSKRPGSAAAAAHGGEGRKRPGSAAAAAQGGEGRVPRLRKRKRNLFEPYSAELHSPSEESGWLATQALLAAMQAEEAAAAAPALPAFPTLAPTAAAFASFPPPTAEPPRSRYAAVAQAAPLARPPPPPSHPPPLPLSPARDGTVAVALRAEHCALAGPTPLPPLVLSLAWREGLTVGALAALAAEGFFGARAGATLGLGRAFALQVSLPGGPPLPTFVVVPRSAPLLHATLTKTPASKYLA